MQLHQLSDLAQDAERLLDWLKSAGLRAEQSRFRQYADDLHRAADLAERADIPEHTKRLENATAANAHHELSDLLEVYEAFGDDPPTPVLDRLRFVIEGPDDRAGDSCRSCATTPGLSCASLASAHLLEDAQRCQDGFSGRTSGFSLGESTAGELAQAPA